MFNIFAVRGATAARSDVAIMWSILHIDT